MARNISNNIPLEFERVKFIGENKKDKKIVKYKFIKKYNDNNYLYQNIENGFFECFCASDLGLVTSVKSEKIHRNILKIPKI